MYILPIIYIHNDKGILILIYKLQYKLKLNWRQISFKTSANNADETDNCKRIIVFKLTDFSITHSKGKTLTIILACYGFDSIKNYFSLKII